MMRKQRQVKSDTDALIMKPAQVRSYADVLCVIRTSANPEDIETAVKMVRKTQPGKGH